MHDDFKLEHTYNKLPDCFFSVQSPSLVPEPALVLFNSQLAKEMGLDEAFFRSDRGIGLLSGQEVAEEAIAQAYAGHQFGHFTMLGDGRAILLGEYRGADNTLYDLQLKGAGRTPYSRRGDGKATLGPMLREYIISEGMAGLGIPTTRSLAVVTTGEMIMRERPLEGAILTRLAKSHIRVGTFQYAARWGTREEVRALADYTLKRHFEGWQDAANPYVYLLEKVVERQAYLIAKWQLVGFIHGVMNTDNMTISGETIDYGPCAFMDVYKLDTVFSSIDTQGRYAYRNQPPIAGWNLARFAESLLSILHEDKEEAMRLAQEAVSKFPELYRAHWYKGMRGKLGLLCEQVGDTDLIHDLLNIMAKYEADYTNTFLSLTIDNLEGVGWFETEDFKKWHEDWQGFLHNQGKPEEEVKKLMVAHNPTVIPRNHRVEEAIEAWTRDGDEEPFKKLVQAIQRPYDYDHYDKQYTTVPETKGCGYQTYCGT